MLALDQPKSIAPLISFRIIFGLIACWLSLRMMLLGWVDKFYIQPHFAFRLWGTHWLPELPAMALYSCFFLMAAAGLGIALGYKYKFSAGFFFACFTYVELLDLTHYLNHYYLVALLALLLWTLPAHRAFSLDYPISPNLVKVPALYIWTPRLLFVLVYFFAGLAKLQSDWLVLAQPLRIWLGQLSDFPIFGPLLSKSWLPPVFAYFGAAFDLSVGFFLLWPKSRKYAYFFVISFHLATAALFHIGIFPYLMMACTTIFFSSHFHEKIIATFAQVFNLTLSKLKLELVLPPFQRYFLLSFLLFQALFPLRHHLYTGNVLWQEQGFRFSWMVMLVEKRGYAQFKVVDGQTGKMSWVNNLDHLNEKQEMMMAYQADMLLQFAHYLANYYQKEEGYQNPQVYLDAQVSLNGRPSQRLVDPQVNLAQEKAELFSSPHWLLPFNKD
ncbi:Vitamin K-dependent gamma-carboxylase [Saprospira grandis DSM 2844]|uniref:Vitamin K-dependent gamma-carboxylase n=1 Tax=Saprospira grandis DSM 2844 TaxID=694433 RepID=J0XU24_9BACT|nr:HTTM domain-containing protein [Saprospira grandis]EJF52466.1 Vitamin K-dependent gamma-carboxylase [Saprospira grandis DSM 2844]